MRERYLTGTIKRHPDGFGFLIPDDPKHPDVYVPRQHMMSVMTNDKVKALVYPDREKGRFRGEIVGIIKRSILSVMGRFDETKGGGGIILDQESTWGANLKIEAKDRASAKPGDLVKVEITSYPDDAHDFEGKVVEVLGPESDPLYDTRKVIHAHQIPDEFSSKTLEECKRFPKEVMPEHFRSRIDLRSMPFVTIDGATAKDFDDAICVRCGNEGFHLWVAIADVSHYVKPGTALDKDAFQRGTSTYFPRFVVPMLPEELSNELCSLKPNVPRLTVVSEMQFDFAGQMVSKKFYEAVIQSQARITYGEAQEVIDGSGNPKFDHVKEMIHWASDLAKILMVKRYREGAMDLEIADSQILLDPGGVPLDIIKAERLFAHKLIEEMMLIANVAVAQFFDENQVPAIYRIHEEPAEDSVRLLAQFLTAFTGKKSDLSGGALQKKITRALQSFGDKPQREILNILTLRTMKQAKYSADNVGHFGLHFSHYSHFTSPIRRYPDLIVHRILKSILYKNAGYPSYEYDDLVEAGTLLSACEQRSVKAERQFNSIKRARFMHKFLGQEFEGVISGVAKFGVFVLLRRYDVDGLVKLEDLGSGRLQFDEDRLTLTDLRSGYTFNIGDPVTVQVVATDPEEGKITFGLLTHGEDKRPMGGPTPRQGGVGKKQAGGSPDRGLESRHREAGPKWSKGKYAGKFQSKAQNKNRGKPQGSSQNKTEVRGVFKGAQSMSESPTPHVVSPEKKSSGPKSLAKFVEELAKKNKASGQKGGGSSNGRNGRPNQKGGGPERKGGGKKSKGSNGPGGRKKRR